MIILSFFGFFLCNLNPMLHLLWLHFFNMYVIFFLLILLLSNQVGVENFFLSNLFLKLMGFYIILYAHNPTRKMKALNVVIVILLKLASLFYLMHSYYKNIGSKLFRLPLILLTVCPHLYFTINLSLKC